MVKLLLWCILLVICWPLALAALFLFPLIWLILLPFRLLGIVVISAFVIVRTLFELPARAIRSL